MPAPRFKLTAPTPTEDWEAQCLVEWAHTQRYGKERLSDLLVMIPNGVKLSGTPAQRAITMARLKRMGFRPGCYDYFLAIPPGLWIELKRTKLGVLSDDQVAFGALMTRMGWQTVVVKGWEEAMRAIQQFIGPDFPASGPLTQRTGLPTKYREWLKTQGSGNVCAKGSLRHKIRAELLDRRGVLTKLRRVREQLRILHLSHCYLKVEEYLLLLEAQRYRMGEIAKRHAVRTFKVNYVARTIDWHDAEGEDTI